MAALAISMAPEDILAVPALKLPGLLLGQVDRDLAIHEWRLVSGDDMELDRRMLRGERDRRLERPRCTVGAVDRDEQSAHAEEPHGVMRPSAANGRRGL
jgi:hypothetical protein